MRKSFSPGTSTYVGGGRGSGASHPSAPCKSCVPRYRMHDSKALTSKKLSVRCRGLRGRWAWTTVLQRTRKLPLSNSRKHPNPLRDWTCHPSTAVRPTHMAGYLPGLATWLLAGSSLRPTSSEVAAGCARSEPEVDPKRHISTHLWARSTSTHFDPLR